MAIDFPNSPTLNQDYTVGTTTWTYDGAKWILKTYNSLHAVPVTAMMLWANTTYPTGWLLADGSAISRTTYADLFAAIGTTYGVGDGSSTFNIPSMSSAGSGSPNTIIKVTNSGALEPSAISHAANHIRGGSDIIDGDRVSLDYVPTNYTRNSAASGAGAVTDLTAHLDGINTTLARPSVYVTQSIDRTITPGATGYFLWDTEVYDTDSMHSVATNTNRLTATTAGVYLLQFNGRTNSSGTPTNHQTFLSHYTTGHVEKVLSFYYFQDAPSTGVQSYIMSAVFRAAAGEYFSVRVAGSTSGGTITQDGIASTNPPASSFSATLLSY